MRFYSVLVLVLGLLALNAAPVQARGNTGDMFGDADWVGAGHPTSSSCAARFCADAIRPYPLLYNRDADLFDGVRANRIATREDVLTVYPAAFPLSPPFKGWANR